MSDLSDLVIPGLLVVLAALIGLIIWGTVAEHKQWEEFRVAHQCKVVGRMRGDVLTTVVPSSNGSVGVGITTTSDKTGWQCDDGVTYWR